MSALIVFVGAGIGGMIRHWVNLAAVKLGSGFPWGTMTINILGSILMGVVTGWFAARSGPMQARLFIATGILGGFTTFSTFSLEAFTLLQRGDVAAAMVYVLTSVIVGVGGLAFGLLLMRHVL